LFSSRRRHTRFSRDWSSDVCSSDLTAKPSEAERGGVPHHCLDLVDPKQAFNVADYRRHALAAIEDIHRRGRLPILSGGTGLYVRAVVDEFSFPARGADWELRRRPEDEAQRLARA